MPTITLTSKFRKNEGIFVSPTELRALFFYGVTIKSKDGTDIATDTYRSAIKSAQAEFESYLGVKFNAQIIEENMSFFNDEFRQNGYIKVSYPVKKPFKLTGFLGTIRQIEYPDSWLSTRKTNDGETYYRHMYLVPNIGSATSFPATFSGVIPTYGLNGYANVPNYWQAVYCTGFSKMPYDIFTAMGMFATIPIFAIAGDLILGAGIASQSLSIDGLSASVSSTSSATNSGFGSRIVEYRKSIKETLDRLRSKYRGANLTSL